MGTRPPRTVIAGRSRHPNNNQPPPRKDPALPCATPTTTTPEARTHHAPHRDRSSSGSRSVQFSPTNPTSKHARQAQGPKPHAPPREPSTNSRPAEARPISTRNSTDLGTGYDRSRREFRPISRRNRTDLVAEPDRSRRGGGEGMTKGRAGPRAARPLGVGRRRREETATPTPLALFPCQAREMREASSTCSSVGRTPV